MCVSRIKLKKKHPTNRLNKHLALFFMGLIIIIYGFDLNLKLIKANSSVISLNYSFIALVFNHT